MYMSVRRLAVALVLALATSWALLSLPAEAGTRARPTPLGTYARVGHDWRAKVLSINRNANRVVADENQFNEPPRRGYQYVMVKVRGNKVSAGRGNLYYTVDFNLFGRKTKHLYGYSYQVIPHDLSNQDDVLKGGTVTGNLLFEVRKSDIRAGGMKLRAEAFLEKPVSWFKFST